MSQIPDPRTWDIAPITWLTPNAVLGTESRFTAWLAEHLDLLGSALRIGEPELVGTEIDVAGKRLDILSVSSTDATGVLVGIAIEAQYGDSDHDHLGKLLTMAK